MLALLGAPALIALADRSAGQLDVIHPDVFIADGKGIAARSSHAAVRPAEGSPLHLRVHRRRNRRADSIVPRSTRTIVRFAHSELAARSRFRSRLGRARRDRRRSDRLRLQRGCPPSRWQPRSTTRRAWRANGADAGLALVHWRSAISPTAGRAISPSRAWRQPCRPLGMSLSELAGLAGGAVEPEQAALELAENYDLDRVCIHADELGLAVTRGDPGASSKRCRPAVCSPRRERRPAISPFPTACRTARASATLRCLSPCSGMAGRSRAARPLISRGLPPPSVSATPFSQARSLFWAPAPRPQPLPDYPFPPPQADRESHG